MAEAEDLYRSDTLVVREIAAPDRSRWIVTFDNHSIGAGFDRPGFAEKFLRRQRISALHILGRGNDWYQYPDVFDACAAARAAVPEGARLMTYGSSMGGAAALRFARVLGAEAVLALSPQYTIDPAVVPWEERWLQDGARIGWLPALAGPIEASGRSLVIFDPTGPDRRHAALIRAEVPGDDLAIRYGGHPVATFLAETGLLRPIVRGLLEDTLDLAALRRQVRAARRTSPRWLGELAERQPAWRPRLAVALARAAHAARPDDPGTLLPLVRALTRAGETAEAQAAGRTMLSADRRGTEVLIACADAMIAAGDAAGAVSLAAEAVAGAPDRAHLADWAAGIHAAAGDLSAAIAEQRRAVALAPGIARFAEALDRYLAETAPIRAPGWIARWLGRG